MKTYKQMKMYNDPALNPVLYAAKNKKLPRHLLVIRTSAMGDVAMLPHALRALKEAYPEVKVTVATKSLFHPFFEGVDVDFWISKPAARTGVSGAPFGSPAKRPS